MPDKNDPAGKEPRSFEAGEEDGYATDTFSRNDREGRPGPDLTGLAVSASLRAGEEDGYATDAFSRNDREGVPTPDEADDGAAKPDPLKAGDDRDSRDATPPPIRDGAGGVR
jgi:hypothetical protein